MISTMAIMYLLMLSFFSLISGYSATLIKPYDSFYKAVVLAPNFAPWTITLHTDVELDLKSLAKGHIDRLPMMCLREGGPPLPDVSEGSLKGLVLDQFYNQSTIQPLDIQKCYALHGNTSFTLTNDQVSEGAVYIGLFNGLGPARTQSKMINRGKPYTFSGMTSEDACISNLWDRYCNMAFDQLPCQWFASHQDAKTQNTTTGRMTTFSCRNSSHSCHGNMSPKLYFLEVKTLSEELTLTAKAVKRSDQVSLMCYARNGAIATENLFDYSIDISTNPLRIKSPKLGTWFFYIVPVGTQHNQKLCYSLEGEVLAFPRENAYSITDNMEPFIISNSSQENNLDNGWIYFLTDIPEDASARNIRIELTTNTSIDYELYARLGGLPSLDAWDYYYANQTSNSNNGSLFKLYDSSNQQVKLNLIYAKEGTWVIGLRRQNFMFDSRSQTNLSISLEPCPGQCSGFGTCDDDDNELKAYCSFCECDRFHGGFDCSVEIVSKAEQKLQIVFLVGSNAAAIFPAMWALWQKSYAEWVIFLSSGAASAIYHACDVQWKCILDYNLLQFLDFWLSFVAVITTAVYMAFISEAAKGAILSVVWILTAIMAIGDATSSNNIIFVVILGVVCLVVGLLVEISTKYKSFTTIFHRPTNMRSWFLRLVKKLYRRFCWRFVILGFATLALALTSFYMENSQNYWIWHSMWHVAIYIAAFFFLYSKVNVESHGSKPNVNDDFQVVPTESPHNAVP